MRLEEAIHQKVFRDQYQKFIVHLAYTNSQLNNKLNDLLKSHDLTIQQYNVLRILRGQLPKFASIRLISERMVDRSSNASRLVQKLIDKGLVGREVNEEDRRQVDVSITARGKAVLERADAGIDGFLESLQVISEKDLERVNNALDKLNEIISNS